MTYYTGCSETDALQNLTREYYWTTITTHVPI